MNHPAVPREHFHRLHPFAFREVRRNVEVLIGILTVGSDSKFRNAEHYVGLDVPAPLEFRSVWQMLRITFLPPVVHPSADGLDLRFLQPWIVRECTHLCLGVPD